MEQPQGFSKLDNLNMDNCFNVGAIDSGAIVLDYRYNLGDLFLNSKVNIFLSKISQEENSD